MATKKSSTKTSKKATAKKSPAKRSKKAPPVAKKPRVDHLTKHEIRTIRKNRPAVLRDVSPLN